jgi:hypothetical protein
MAEELEMADDALSIRFGTALDVQLDTLQFHLDIFVFLSGEICRIEGKENRVRKVRLALRV